MSTDTALTATAAGTVTETHDDHASHDISDRQYIVIALILAVITAMEVTASYLDLGSWLVPLLLVMMVIKFFTVVSYFMHLKFDNKMCSYMFYIGLGGAVVLFTAVLFTFHFFTG